MWHSMQIDHCTGGAAQDHLTAPEVSTKDERMPDTASMSPVRINDQAMSCLNQCYWGKSGTSSKKLCHRTRYAQGQSSDT